MPKWIYTDEGLPESSKVVWVAIKTDYGSYVDKGYYSEIVEGWSRADSNPMDLSDLVVDVYAWREIEEVVAPPIKH